MTREVVTKSAQTCAPSSGIVDLSGWWVFTPTRVGPRARVPRDGRALGWLAARCRA
jgi:hypothetical protein